MNTFGVHSGRKTSQKQLTQKNHYVPNISTSQTECNLSSTGQQCKSKMLDFFSWSMAPSAWYSDKWLKEVHGWKKLVKKRQKARQSLLHMYRRTGRRIYSCSAWWLQFLLGKPLHLSEKCYSFLFIFFSMVELSHYISTKTFSIKKGPGKFFFIYLCSISIHGRYLR